MPRSGYEPKTLSYGVRLTPEEWAWVDAAPGQTRTDRVRYRMKEGATVDLAASKVGQFFAVPFARFEEKLDRLIEASPESMAETLATQTARLIQQQTQAAAAPPSSGYNPAQMTEFRAAVAELLERGVVPRAAKGNVQAVQSAVARLRAAEVPAIPALANGLAVLTEALILPQAGNDYSAIGGVVTRLKNQTRKS